MKYILHPGKVRSITDGDWHFVGYNELLRLYRLSPQSCIAAGPDTRYRSDDIHLYPNERGIYKLPGAPTEGGE